MFIPTRPTSLRPGDRLRIFAVALGGQEATRVTLFTRSASAEKWQAGAMKLLGRRTFATEIETPPTATPLLAYYVKAEFRVGGTESVATAPLAAPARFYTVTLL